MKKKEYLQFYKLETEADAKGRLRTVAVYKGDYFAILNKPQEVKRTGVFLFVIFGLYIAVTAALLLLDIPSAYEVYIVLPSILSVFAAAGAFYYATFLFKKGGKYTVFDKMKAETRLNQWAIFSAILAVITSLARTVFLIATRPKEGLATEIISVLFGFFMVLALVYAQKIAKKIRFESINPPSE